MNLRNLRTRVCGAHLNRAAGGWTVAELVVAAAVASIILMIVMLLFMVSGRSFAAMGNYVDLDARSRKALDVMIREIRQAKALTYYATNSLGFTDFNDQQLSYTWDPATGDLSRSVNGQPDESPLLTGCDQLSFKIYQRNPSNAVYGFFVPDNNLGLCKLVEVSWLCSRKILGDKVNSESVQTTKIVIRNQKVQN